MMRFDRFTEKAQEAAMRAYEMLQRYKHTQVDTEHIFLALLQQQDSAVPQILEKLDAPSGGHGAASWKTCWKATPTQ